MKALLFGAAGTLVETSRLERLAYNAAFEELGLGLYWNVATYCRLLELPGGPRRLDAVFAGDWLAGLTDEIYDAQEKHFERLAARGLVLRPGVSEALRFCADQNIRLGWVTTATSGMLDTLFDHTEGLDAGAFEIILGRDDAPREKPDPSIYDCALDVMNLDPSEVVAVEDSSLNQAAALAADLQCYVFPGEYAHVDHDVLVTRELPGMVRRAHTLWTPEAKSTQHEA